MTEVLVMHPLRTWSRASAVAGIAFGLLSGVLIANEESLLAWGERFYSGVEASRFPYFAERVAGGAWFLPLLSGACFLWALALAVRARRPPSERLSTSTASRFRWIALSAGVVSLVGISIWFSNAEWVRFDRPCWDFYCDYASLIHAWLTHRNPSTTAALIEHMRVNIHANSPVVPFLVASVMHLGIDVTTSYRLCCGAATLATMAVLWRTLNGLGYDREISWASLFLFWTNLTVIRSFVFPQTDAFAMLWPALLLYLYLKPPWTGWRWDQICILLTLTSALLVKLSLLSMMALPFAWFVVARRLRPDSPLAGKPGVREMLLLTVIPLVVFVSFQGLFRTSTLFLAELKANAAFVQDSFIPFVAIAFVVSCGFFVVLAFLGRIRQTPADAFVFAWIAVYVGCIWLGRAAGWNRYYLPVLPAFTIVAAPGLARVRSEAGAVLMWLLVSGVALLNYLGLSLRIYY